MWDEGNDVLNNMETKRKREHRHHKYIWVWVYNSQTDSLLEQYFDADSQKWKLKCSWKKIKTTIVPLIWNKSCQFDRSDPEIIYWTKLLRTNMKLRLEISNIITTTKKKCNLLLLNAPSTRELLLIISKVKISKQLILLLQQCFCHSLSAVKGDRPWELKKTKKMVYWDSGNQFYQRYHKSAKMFFKREWNDIGWKDMKIFLNFDCFVQFINESNIKC